MGWDGAEEIVEAPHFLREIGSRKDPAAAQAAESIYLCKAAGDHEFFPEMKGAPGRCVERRVKIDLVNQDLRSDLPGDAAYLSHSLLAGERAAGIVKIGQNYEPGAWCNTRSIADGSRAKPASIALGNRLTSAPR